MPISAQDKAVDFGLPVTIPIGNGRMTIDADQEKQLVTISLFGVERPISTVAVDGIQARQIASAIHAGVRLLAGTSFDMHRRESDRGPGAD
jgi:hypothetical protein